MKVILDTTVLHMDPFFKNTEMVKLRNLCSEGKIKLIIPRFVIQEYITQEREKLKSGKEYLATLENRYTKAVYDTEKNMLASIIKNMKKTIAEGDKTIENRIDTFILETKAKIIEPTFEEYKETFGRYFNGDKPFKTIKSREDIPDGIIFSQVKNIKDETVVFISNDKNLRESVARQDITVFSNLSDFITSDNMKNIIEFKEIDNLLLYHLPILMENENLQKIFYNALEEELVFKKITDEKIPDDNYEGTITGVLGIDPIEFTKSEIVKLGDGLFTIPFYCEIDATLEYYLYKADYFCLDEDKMQDIYIDDWNEHYFQAEEEYPLICTGNLGIQFNPHMLNKEFSNINQDKLLQETKISFSELEIVIKDY
ncbi:MAG: PIN domain-containing protein [Treponema sp.]|jgi:rRNA-processing protein FCF1|nr:PIN domain-containing protein [Treponema sp.]